MAGPSDVVFGNRFIRVSSTVNAGKSFVIIV